jgi:hypothetical protein
MTFRWYFICAVLIGVACTMCAACIPIPGPGQVVFVSVSDMVTGEIKAARRQREYGLQTAVTQAIAHDSVEEYTTSWKACGTICDSSEFGQSGSVYAPWIKAAIRGRAWHVVAYQLSQASPELKQRLLHMAGTRDYGGSKEFVTVLLDSGARPDGVALANAVSYCRAGMVELLLERGVAPQGKYTGDDDNDDRHDPGINDHHNDVGNEKFSLLSLASIVHCDSDIREKLLAYGADPNDIDPVLQKMQAAIAIDNPVTYELAWRACSETTYCRSRGWNPAPLGIATWHTEPEAAWVDDAIMARAWRVVAVQLKRASQNDRDMLLSAAPAYYPERPELIALLRSSGAKPDGSSWTPNPLRGPPEPGAILVLGLLKFPFTTARVSLTPRLTT